MNRSSIIALAVLVVLLLGSGVAYSASQHKKVVADTAIHQVSLMGDHAEPAELLIKVGETVQFNSKDGLSHNLGAGTGGDIEAHQHDDDSFESGEFKSDEAYKARFSTVGVFYLHDHLHPKITITIAVYDPNKK